MSTYASRRQPFAGRERTFCLTIDMAGELERLCNAGIGAIMVRLASHQFYVADIREPIRLALQGGGMGEPEATALVMHNVDGKPLAAHIQLAADVLGDYVNGVPDEIKKKAAASGRARRPRRAMSASGTSSAA